MGRGECLTKESMVFADDVSSMEPADLNPSKNLTSKCQSKTEEMAGFWGSRTSKRHKGV